MPVKVIRHSVNNHAVSEEQFNENDAFSKELNEFIVSSKHGKNPSIILSGLISEIVNYAINQDSEQNKKEISKGLRDAAYIIDEH